MKSKVVSTLGKFLMRFSGLSICIIDDEEAYFNPHMVSAANNIGFKKIERYHRLDKNLFESLQKEPRDIVVLDIKGVVDKEVAKDGLEVASVLKRTTNSYIVITSAHQYHLRNNFTQVDYIIEDRILTIVDFIDILIEIVDDCLCKRIVFYKKISFKIGFSLLKQSIA